MTTPQGGPPDEGPTRGRGEAPGPDPDVTSIAGPPRDAPFPGSRPPAGGWSESGGAPGSAAPGDPTVAGGWPPPPPPGPPVGGAQDTRVDWAPPPGSAPPGWAPPGSAPPGWAAPGSAPPGSAPSGWAAPGGGPPPQSGGWGPAPPGWGTPPGPHQPWPGGPPTQVGAPWGPPPGGPYPGWGPPPPPPPRRGRLVALVAVGVLLLAALGVGGYLLVTRTSGGPVVPADFRPITTTTLTYAVPPGWQDSPSPGAVLGAPLEGRAEGPGYDCGGGRYLRGLVASAFVPGERPAAAVAAAFARETGSAFYSTADGDLPEVRVSDARPFDVGGVPGRLVEATARTPADDGCLATSGTVLLLAVPTAGPDGLPGTAVLVVNGDTAGGPADAPPVADRATLDAVLASARLPTI